MFSDFYVFPRLGKKKRLLASNLRLKGKALRIENAVTDSPTVLRWAPAGCVPPCSRTMYLLCYQLFRICSTPSPGITLFERWGVSWSMKNRAIDFHPYKNFWRTGVFYLGSEVQDPEK
jgi:hypothetical protein